MPRSYQRTTNRQSWSQEAMVSAIKEVMEGRSGCKRASDTFGVPKSTLEEKVKKARSNNLTPELAAEKRLGRFRTIFSNEQELELVNHIEGRPFGATPCGIRRSAYAFAKKNCISHNFSNQRQEAGKDWLYGFLRRHPKLSVRSAKETSSARTEGSNRISGGKFFDLSE